MDPERRSYRSALNKAQQFLMYDCTPEAADQRELIAIALRSLQQGHVTPSTVTAVEMARAVVKGGAA